MINITHKNYLEEIIVEVNNKKFDTQNSHCAEYFYKLGLIYWYFYSLGRLSIYS